MVIRKFRLTELQTQELEKFDWGDLETITDLMIPLPAQITGPEGTYTFSLTPQDSSFVVAYTSDTAGCLVSKKASELIDALFQLFVWYQTRMNGRPLIRKKMLKVKKNT